MDYLPVHPEREQVDFLGGELTLSKDFRTLPVHHAARQYRRQNKKGAEETGKGKGLGT